MGNPFTAPTLSNYNSNPPPDDGTAVATNEAKWTDVKTKLADPLSTYSQAVSSAVNTALAKLVGGAGVTSTAISYSVVAGDQGKLIRATASGVTITTPDATVVGSPFVFAVLNKGGGNITLDGSGSQTIDGAATVTLEDTRGCFLFTDGTNWFTAGQNWQFSEPDRPVNLFNGSFAISVAANAITIALKNDAGTDPSATNSVLVAFRNSPVTDGGFTVREVTAALSLVVPAGATLGYAASETNNLHIGLIDNSGTVEIGVSKEGTLWTEDQLVSTTLIDTASDSGTVIYTTAARTTKPCRLACVVRIAGGSTAGNWSNAASRITAVNSNPLQFNRNSHWGSATFSVVGTAISPAFAPGTDGFNIADVVRSSEGVCAVTFKVAVPSANYRVTGNATHENVANICVIPIASSKTTTGFTLTFLKTNETGVNDPGTCDFSVVGTI